MASQTPSIIFYCFWFFDVDRIILDIKLGRLILILSHVIVGNILLGGILWE